MKRLVIVLLLLTSCAVQHSQAPQIDSKTAYALNLESQVTQANKDYITFFSDVGKAQAAGQLSAATVQKLNTIGAHLRTILQEADTLTRTYAQNYDQSIASQIGGLLAQAAADFSALTTAQGGK